MDSGTWRLRRWTSLMMVGAIMTACAVNDLGCGASNTVKGGAVGAGVGGVIGGIIGHSAGNTAVGAIIGAAVGGTAGALIGNYMDKQAEEMRRDLQNARIERIGEGIKITFESGLLFETNSTRLSEAAKQNIRSLANILNKYDDTDILVEGHTDSTGTDRYNQTLSEDRADAVANYAKGLGVKGDRFSTIGYGETQPVTSNASSDGRR